MLAYNFADIRLIHVGCVALSGGLFFVRGLLRIGDHPAANHSVLRVAIDTRLLTAGILLTAILHQFPFIYPWLTSKLLGAI